MIVPGGISEFLPEAHAVRVERPGVVEAWAYDEGFAASAGPRSE
jgi:hypothetical protein